MYTSIYSTSVEDSTLRACGPHIINVSGERIEGTGVRPGENIEPSTYGDIVIFGGDYLNNDDVEAEDRKSQ